MTRRGRKLGSYVVLAGLAAGLLSAGALGDRTYSRLWSEWRGLTATERLEFRAQYQDLVRSNSRDLLLRRARQFASLSESEKTRLVEAHELINEMVRTISPRAREHFRSVAQPVKAAKVLEWVLQNKRS